MSDSEIAKRFALNSYRRKTYSTLLAVRLREGSTELTQRQSDISNLVKQANFARSKLFQTINSLSKVYLNLLPLCLHSFLITDRYLEKDL